MSDHAKDPRPPAPAHQVRAHFDDESVRVYQAYSPAIALPALRAQTFVPPFKLDRMTWIKPSFTWMMYRSGWGRKPGQEHVLGIDITRAGLEHALSRACLSHYSPRVHESDDAWRALLRESPVRIQWDPERTLSLGELPYRAIQIGLSGDAVRGYVEEWIVGIEDVTALAHEVESLVKGGEMERARAKVPREQAYPLPEEIRKRIGGSPETGAP